MRIMKRLKHPDTLQEWIVCIFFQGTLGIGILAQMRLQTGAMMTWMSPAADRVRVRSSHPLRLMKPIS